LLQHRARQSRDIFRRNQFSATARSKCFRDAIQRRRNHRFAAGMRFADDQAKGLRANLRVDQAVDGVHHLRHVGDLARQPCFAAQAQSRDVVLEKCSHAAAANDEEPGPRHFFVKAGGGGQKLALTLAARQVVTSDHCEGIIPRLQAQLASYLRRVCRTEYGGIDASGDDMDFGVVALKRRAGAAFRLRGLRFIHALSQNFRDKSRNRDQCIALPQQKPTAGPGTGAFGQMTGEHELGPGPGQARRKNGRPDIAAMMAMHNLNLLASDKSRGAKSESKFAARWPGIQEGHAGTFDRRFKLPARRPGQPDFLAQPVKLRRQFDALVVRPPPGEHGVDV